MDRIVTFGNVGHPRESILNYPCLILEYTGDKLIVVGNRNAKDRHPLTLEPLDIE